MLDGRLFYYDYKDQENYILIDRVKMEHVSNSFTAINAYNFLIGHCKKYS